MKPRAEPRLSVRCAIYTRKSTEEGLDQAFNSLQAQREACAAYVLSQAGEGWGVLPTRYDDGGCSGGNLDRPALRQLLFDIDAGLVDTIVVYKIDRLTRSLADFAKIVERLDATDTNFVSVTQAFNTTTSMGRLTLNVLLSFAQFEREVTGERIRDKIAASKAKGMWMGGALPLGYDGPTDPMTRALVVNGAEAATVRTIFTRYLELGSVHELRDWLNGQGYKPKQLVSRSGKARGADHFNRGALFHLLRNRVYLGETVHRELVHPGRHAAILDRELFDAVQARLDFQAATHRERPLRVAEALLRGKIFDTDGRPMSPTFSRGKSGRMYRYYVTTDLQQGGSTPPEGVRRLSAPAVEECLAEIVRRLAAHPEMAWSEGAKLIGRVDVHPRLLVLTLKTDCITGRARGIESRLTGEESLTRQAGQVVVEVPACVRRGGKTWIALPNGQTVRPRPINSVLVRALKVGHAALRDAGLSPEARHDAIAVGAAPPSAHNRKLCLLAFLAPDIQSAILNGRQPQNLTLEQLTSEELPLGWAEQRRALGF